ncbi:PREDICTED: embryogenesis-associated protein EMB8-like [Ipomoea nil]|uniref:embryogenesis-associated protein EMB8-like n=1 Tax=Ipomoea nil TaxID=35883 RepID=UPI000901F67F|nr:PREDICTED: embryogenesis-associated protein EMB8-like [Ipomoea nil]
MDGCLDSVSHPPYELLLRAASLIPISHYLFAFLSILIFFLYHFIEIHFFRDLLAGFRGQTVSLTFSPCSQLYQEVVSKCRILHGRFSSTPWLCSPHLQTTFLHFFGMPPVCNYRRKIFHTPDGGTIALDWLTIEDVRSSYIKNCGGVYSNDKSPILIVVPGLTSDSDSAYVKHLVFKMAKHGWRVVVCNHRGLGGVSITSERFYNAGWTEDIRKVIDHLHTQYPEAPLFSVGTSIGANVLVKYLGEDGVNTPIAGAAAICSPWDLLTCDRFINRRLIQRFYDKALTIGLKGYAQLHESIMSRLVNWEGITMSNSVRDFDNHATRVLAKYETVDTYYRRCSSTNYVGNVMIPLLCISALDDPVCTREAIPWDECRANKNIVLATTEHGGHLAYFEGLTAKSVWWVRAVDEFFRVLSSSPLIKERAMQDTAKTNPIESSIDQAPYVSVMDDGMVSAVTNEPPPSDIGCCELSEHTVAKDKAGDGSSASAAERNGVITPQEANAGTAEIVEDAALPPVRKCLNQLSRRSKASIWLLAYVAILTTLPILGSALPLLLKKRLRNIFSGLLQRK